MRLDNIKKLLVGAVFMGAFAPASAAVICDANITSVLFYSSGAVNIKHTGAPNYTVVCNLKNEWKGVSIPTCAMWASTLQNAKKDSKKLRFYYSDSSTYSSCSELPTYSNAPVPVYIGDIF